MQGCKVQFTPLIPQDIPRDRDTRVKYAYFMGDLAMERVRKAAACGARQGTKAKDLGGRKKIKRSSVARFHGPVSFAFSEHQINRQLCKMAGMADHELF